MISLFRKKKSETHSEEQLPTSHKVKTKKISERELAKLRAQIEKDAKKGAHKRQTERRECHTVAMLKIVETEMKIDGLITDVSSGGVNFRPASRYIQERIGDRVKVQVGDLSCFGVIRVTRPSGYGIQLLSKLEEDDVITISEASIEMPERAVA